ncbi:MAG: YihY/virulence factor BrkB family protein [Actinocatenispora sp.]
MSQSLPSGESRTAPAPAGPSELKASGLWATLKRLPREVKDDNLTDWAAALTYYAVLSIFPALLVLVSVLGLIGRSATQPILDNLTNMAPGVARSVLTPAIQNLQQGQATAGVVAIVGILLALWSASGYVAAFMRAANVVYDVPEGRPVWKTIPIRLGITVIAGVILALSAAAVVFTGPLAERLGNAIGAGSVAVLVWDIAKWPVMVVAISFLFAILYWASPNARQAGFRWVSPGGVLAVVVWLVASGAFAFYVTNFGSYNKTYGAVAGLIIFLIWLWLTNLAILLGAELNAELHRSRAIAAGHPPDAEPYTRLRDDRKLDKPEDDDIEQPRRRESRTGLDEDSRPDHPVEGDRPNPPRRSL